jgi:hypothetical protein
VCFFWLKLLIIIIIGKVVITILFKVSSLFVDIGKEGFFSIGQACHAMPKNWGSF